MSELQFVETAPSKGRTLVARRSLLVMSAISSARVLGANDRVRGGIIGCGVRGPYLTASLKEIGVEMAAVCDVYEPNLQKGLAAASTGARPYADYRRMLEDKSIDVVAIATPDHWHAKMATDAVQAGKDVYVEKPMARTIDEGFRLVDAVRRTKRVLQVGTQRRSSELFQEAGRFVRDGSLGDIRLLNCWWHGKTGPTLSGRPLQGKLDWDQWLGPAPKRPFDPLRFFGWIWFWDYAGGYMVGQTVHILDATHWLMNPAYPLKVTALGKHTMTGSEIPETTTIAVEYPSYLAVFTVGYKAMAYATAEFGHEMKQFHGAQARLDLGREAYAFYPQDTGTLDLRPKVQKRLPGSMEAGLRAHLRDFLDCVRSRRDPRAPAEAGQLSTIVLAMAVESLKSGRTVRYNEAARVIEF